MTRDELNAEWAKRKRAADAEGLPSVQIKALIEWVRELDTENTKLKAQAAEDTKGLEVGKQALENAYLAQEEAQRLKVELEAAKSQGVSVEAKHKLMALEQELTTARAEAMQAKAWRKHAEPVLKAARIVADGDAKATAEVQEKLIREVRDYERLTGA